MKNYKHIRCLLYLLFIFNTAISQDFWEIITPPDVSYIRSIEANNEKLYLSTDYGLYKSSNNGLSWELLAFESQNVGLIDINELGYIHVYAKSMGNVISRSVDNGLTWEVFSRRVNICMYRHKYYYQSYKIC